MYRADAAHAGAEYANPEAIDLQALAFARLGDVLATTESFGDQPVMVIDHERKSGRSIGP